ncbi:unnamed protein product [Rhodiola kirilowii]
MKDHNSTSSATPANPALKQRVYTPTEAGWNVYRMRGNAKPKSGDSPKSESSSNGQNGGALSSPPSSVVEGRVRPVPGEVVSARKVRRQLALNPVEEGGESVKCSGGSGNGRRLMPVVEKCAPLMRRTGVNGVGRSEEAVMEVNRRMHELQEKLDASENVIKELRLEVVKLRDELDDARALNGELQSQNKGLCGDLDAAKAQIAALRESHVQVRKQSSEESQLLTFKDNQNFIDSQFRNVNTGNEVNIGLIVDTGAKTDVEKQRGVPAGPLAPPPPPLPPRHPVRRSASAQQAPTIVQLYRSLSKPEARKDSSTGNSSKDVKTNVHNSIVGEIQNRSSHLMAIKMDIETKGDFINGLIRKVLSTAYTDIEDVLRFVDWLDYELSSLADERSVLKHFPWPERKADAMREAAIEYRDLKLLENEISSYEIDAKLSCELTLKKMAGLLDKSERSNQRLIRLRASVMVSYREYKIPTEWMLDSGMVKKIKHASMRLANLYIKRVTMEIHAMRSSEREYAQEALLLQCVHFAYRAHQFAGELDSETLCAFEELRKSIPGHLVGSRALQSSILSSH